MKVHVRNGSSHKWGIGDYVYLDFEVEGRIVYRKIFHANFSRMELPHENALRWLSTHPNIIISLICEFNLFGHLCAQTAACGLANHLRWVGKLCGLDNTVEINREASSEGCGPCVWWETGPQGWAWALINRRKRPLRSRFILQSAFGYDLLLKLPPHKDSYIRSGGSIPNKSSPSLS